MDSREVVVHEVQGDGVGVVLYFLAEGVGQPREPTHLHSHREVLALDIARRHVLWVRIATDLSLPGSVALSRGIAVIPVWLRPEQFDKHRIVNLPAESAVDGLKISFVAITGKLHPIRQS